MGDTSNPTRMRFFCATPCDEDCDADCHEVHLPVWKRSHQPEYCLGRLLGRIGDESA